MLMEYIVPGLWIVAVIGKVGFGALEVRLQHLEELEEEQFLAGFHQQV